MRESAREVRSKSVVRSLWSVRSFVSSFVRLYKTYVRSRWVCSLVIGYKNIFFYFILFYVNIVFIEYCARFQITQVL